MPANTPDAQANKELTEEALHAQASALAAELGELLVSRKLDFATAESCTGGLISAICTDISGASNWLTGGVVAYCNSVKQNVLGVKEETLIAHGAVSEPVVLAMAEGVRKTLGTTCSVSVSGVAGPTGGTKEKPVGTVWIGCSAGATTIARHHLFSGNREQIRLKTVIAALNMLMELLQTEA